MAKIMLLISFFVLIYCFSVGSDPILGDSLVFTVVAYNGFDLATNATNHFLYMNLLAILHKIFPWINSHYLFVSFGILCSAFTLFFVRKLLLIFNISKNTTNIAVLIFGFSFTFWRTSIITEVYSFYILFVTLFLTQIFLFLKERRVFNFYCASMLFGIMFLIHIQSILLIPFYLFFLYESFKKDKIYMLKGILIPSFLFSILLFPVFQGKHNFSAIFTDNAWGNSFFHLDVKEMVKSFGRNLIFLLYNFLFFMCFIIKGLKKTPLKKYFLLAILPYLLFILKHDVSDSYVFHLVPYLFLLVILAKGLEDFDLRKKYILVFAMPLIYFAAFNIIKITKFGEAINNETGFKGGVRYLFFPPLKGNPDIDQFIKAYNDDQLRDKPSFDRQYKYAKEWMLMKEKFK